MNIITAICVVLCFLIMCSFIFFTIVYLSELKRERDLRKLMMEANEKFHDLLGGGKIPAVIMDIPTSKQTQDLTSDTSNKDKKSVN
jgi:hypothetical protein